MKPYKETSYSTLQDSSEDGIDVEVTDYKTVDDNLDFNTRYTTALKERATGRMVAIVDFNGDEDVIRYCEHCFKNGFKNKLGFKILRPAEQKQPDYEDWLQCHTCGNIYPVYEAKFERKIKDFVKTTDNPFDEVKGQVLGVDNRVTEKEKVKSAKADFHINKIMKIQKFKPR